MTHFACFDCNELLGGQRYFMKSSKPYCCKCFEKIHIEFCATCGKSIGVEQGQITYEDQHWHATDDCFKCYTCSKSLRGGLMFIPKHGVIYCSNACLKYKSNQNNNNTINRSICNTTNVSMSVATPHVNGYLPTMSNSAKLNLIQQQQKQQSPIHSPRHQQMPATPTHSANNITSPNMQRMIIHQQQQQMIQSPGPVSLPISISTAGKQLANTNSNNSNYSSLDQQQQQQLMSALNNQSRSRKPFNFPNDYTDIKQHNQQQSPLNNEMNHSHQSNNYANMRSSAHQDENSFDDLDTVEVINLNQQKLVRSRHSLPDLNIPLEQQQQQQQQMIKKKNQRSNPKNSSGYYYYNENNMNQDDDEDQNYDDPSREKYNSQQNLNMQPTSILKRYDSSEKMYPISRPGHPGHPSSCNNNPYAFQMNDANTNSYGRSHRNSKLIEMNENDMTDHRSRNIMSSSSSTCIGGGTQQPGRQIKRVQFANIPPLTGASSVGDLVNNGSHRRSHHGHRSSHGHHHSTDHRHHHRSGSGRRHHHDHHHGSHRRSSSTSNFNMSTLSSKSHSKRHNPHRHNHSSRHSSNRSLTMNGNNKGFSDSDYYYDDDKNDEYNSAYEYEDDQYTCSTCSSNASNTTTSTTSTDSDSDMDDFGNDILDTYSKFYSRSGFSSNNINNRQTNFDQRSLNRLNMPYSNSNSNGYNRKYSSGLKISYVDNLPLARTNPVLQQQSVNNIKSENKKSTNKKSKSISKFKKDNCTVS